MNDEVRPVSKLLLVVAVPCLLLLAVLLAGPPAAAGEKAPVASQVGTPIVTYWCGPPMTEAVAQQMAEGGWNLVWCEEKDLDLVHRHGLRAQLTNPLFAPAVLDNPAEREKLDALIDRVRAHPALHAYFITDEPNAAQFPALGRLVAHLRERDPAHLAYINLFPTYATNEQLGNKGDVTGAYREHLQQYVDIVKPGLISWDHYQLAAGGDNPQYFLNLALIRRAALDAGLPFLHIVQACSWTPSMRVPVPDEMRYLVYTTLAYGAQGISYYVYCCAGHLGAIAGADGSPTPLYHALKTLNREFVAAAEQVQPLRSLGVFHAGMMPPGAEPVSGDSAFAFDPPIDPTPYAPPEPVRGVLLGLFGPAEAGGRPARATHAVVVNLDYKAEATAGVKGPAPIEVFDPATGRWSPAGAARADIRLPRGGGSLLRAAGGAPAPASAAVPVDLFDGKTLAGWKVIGCEAEVRDGAILLKGGNGVVRTERSYRDYVLEYEWKALKADNWDSGVYFRCGDPPPGAPWPTVYQANLRKGMEGNVEELKDARSTGLTKPGDWNHFKLTVKGTGAQLEINGKPAWKADGLKSPEGYIALQAEIPGGGQFFFRNIRILELGTGR